MVNRMPIHQTRNPAEPNMNDADIATSQETGTVTANNQSHSHEVHRTCRPDRSRFTEKAEAGHVDDAHALMTF